jgi:hypothetical protein
MKYLLIIVLTLAFIFAGLAGAGGRSRLAADFSSGEGVRAKGAPRGWSLKVWRGRPDMRFVGERWEKALRMRSQKASVSLYRNLRVDPKIFPVLSWRWKVTKLPRGADVRDERCDDQAAGVYVSFPRFPSFINSRLIGYVWDSSAPVGTVLKSRKNPMVHYIVVRSGGRDLGRWITECRNVLEDYRRVFGEDPPSVNGVSLMIDTDDTQSEAESYFARIEFKNPRKNASAPRPDRLAGLLGAAAQAR